MKAAVWTDIGKVEVRDVDRPEVKPGWVILKITAAGLCATDIHHIMGKISLTKPPHILGHEMAGVICEIGEGVTGWQLGDRCTVDTMIGCETCKYCKEGNSEFCCNGGEIGYAPYNGAYAEYVAVPAPNLHKLPDNVTDEEAAIIESCVCPCGSMLAHPVKPGETVLVQGAGPAGLAYIQLAKIQGAKKVILSCRKSYRSDLALTLGADVHIDPTKEDLLARVHEETDGYGVDVSIDAAGFGTTVDMAVKCACGGGRVILYGIPSDDDKVDFPVTDIIIKQLSIFGACSSPKAWEPMLKWTSEGKFNLKAMVSAAYRIEDINQAIDDIENRRNNIIKAVLSFK